MEKFVLYIVLIFFSWFLSGCGKCKDLTYCGYLPEMDSYFGMYVPGNWWVYYNQDSTKKDSVYVTDFEERIDEDNKDLCVQFPTRSFTLNTKYLFDTSLGLTGFYSNSGNCCHNQFIISTSGKAFGVSMECIDTLPKGNNEIFYDSFEVDMTTYQNVIFFDGLNAKPFFAQGIGIVKFINLSDTFALIKFHIQ